MKGSAQQRLVEEMAGFATDPLGHARFCYPWGEGALTGIAGPRQWQRDVLHDIGDHLSNPLTRFQPLRIAVASGHGAGKSSTMAMVVLWALTTASDCRVVMTANTEGQLISKTMPELLKWHGMSLTKDWFRPAVTSLSSTQPGHAHSWRCDAIPWSIHQPEAFAGLHNAGRRIVLAFDEASSIPDRIWEVAEGALTDENTEIILLALGNPTRNSGRFRECFGKYRNLWLTRHVDSRDVEGTNKAQLDEMIATYGEESDFAKVCVRGLFPSASSMQLIASDVVAAARERSMDPGSILPNDPVVFSLDHARFGDDSSVLAIRQGRDARSRPWKHWYGANSMEIAGDVSALAAQYCPDAVFIDAGGPNAGGVIDRLRQLNPELPIYEINFGGKGRDATWNGEQRVRVANKRAQMYCDMRAWLERGGIPDEQRLADDLVATEYGYNSDNAILLEKKEHMKARGLASPDWADALALSFAEYVQPREMPRYLDPSSFGKKIEHDPYAELYRDGDVYADLQ